MASARTSSRNRRLAVSIDPRPTADRSRRSFLRAGIGAAAALLLVPAAARARPLARLVPFAGHPDPRPGVDGSRVLPRERVAAHMADLFDGIREIPEVADGIGCHCGCGFIEGMRSLLSCYEGVGMAQGCHICEGEGRLAVRLAKEGASLDEIREAIDRTFG